MYKILILLLLINMIFGISLPCDWHLTCDGCTSNPDCTWCYMYNSPSDFNGGCIDKKNVSETTICVQTNYYEYSFVATNPNECDCNLKYQPMNHFWCKNCTSNDNCAYYYLGEVEIVCTGKTYELAPLYQNCSFH